VEDGRLVRVRPDREHPHATPLCPKGLAGPELVYDPQRLKYPLRRTRPKGEADPGWERISWDEAMEAVAKRLVQIKRDHGAHSVVFNRPGPGGSPAKDYAEWVVRLALAFGSPNTLATGHVCQWHRDTGSKYTYGDDAVPEPDYANTGLLLIWGHNPYTSVRCNVRDVGLARRNGAKLVVIDPRRTEIAREADLWVQLRPGTDGALLLGLIHLLIEGRSFDEAFVRNWTNAPFLVRADTGDLLTAEEAGFPGTGPGFVAWDRAQNRPAPVRPGFPADELPAQPALQGNFQLELAGGGEVEVQPVFECLRHLAAAWPPERVQSITGVPPERLRDLARYLGEIKPAAYYSYNGIEQHTNAMQTNRALCTLYALTGSLERPGGNVYFPKLPGGKVRDAKLLAADAHRLRIGYGKRPLGPAGRSNSSAQAYEVFESILTEEPYPVKALVAFGGNILTANAHTLRGREALRRLDFMVQTELYMTPSAELADIVLPAATFYEAPHLRLGFPNLWPARKHVQYRPRVVPPLHEARSDVEIVFELACRLGLGDRFWGGKLEKAFDAQLRPLGLDLITVKKIPGGVSVDLSMTYEKYRRVDPANGAARGFQTPSGRVELFSQRFKDQGFDPLPSYREPEMSPLSRPQLAVRYPLILTCSKLLPFCHGQHRSVPSLRKRVPEPFVEMHPETAAQRDVDDGEWVRVETPEGQIRLKAKVTDTISPGTVCVQHGWWQSCPELSLPGYPPFSRDGANANLLYSTLAVDPISGSVPYKAYLCEVAKI
jgi:anaerobic selenocysteine-containing dehydrogenase